VAAADATQAYEIFRKHYPDPDRQIGGVLPMDCKTCPICGTAESGCFDNKEVLEDTTDKDRPSRSNGVCERCGHSTIVTTMSYFNTEMICPDCDLKERAHPDFARARETEIEAVRNGNNNFPGIGKPTDL